MPKLKFTKRSQKELKEEFQSCRYCPMGPGAYKVIEGGETSYLCEKHYQEYKEKDELR